MARLHRCAAQRVDRQSQRLVRVLPWCRKARENPRFGMSRYIAHTLSIAHKCRERVRRNDCMTCHNGMPRIRLHALGVGSK